MNILIDGRTFTASSAGISNYLRESVIAWAKLRPSDMFLVALPKSAHSTFSTAGLPPNVTIEEKTNGFFRRMPNLVWLQLMMPIIARRYNFNVYYSPVPCIPFFLPSKTKKIIVVHDVVNIEYQKTMQWTNILVNKLFFFRSIKKADIIWTNSIYTREKVKRYFPERKCQDIFTGASVNRDIYHPISLTDPEKKNILQKYGINQPFILFVGSLEPRKNLSFLLSIIPELYRSKSLQLVVVGGKGWKNSRIKDIVENKDFPRESTIFCGFVPNEDLVRLYHLAQCFVSASLNEGFGMPQLEALLCGCPIITSHNSAMIEIAKGKDGAITIEGYDKEKWIETIQQVIEKRPKVNTSQLTTYNWNIILKNLIETKL